MLLVLATTAAKTTNDMRYEIYHNKIIVSRNSEKEWWCVWCVVVKLVIVVPTVSESLSVSNSS